MLLLHLLNLLLLLERELVRRKLHDDASALAENELSLSENALPLNGIIIGFAKFDLLLH